jgi:hypothetical protein
MDRWRDYRNPVTLADWHSVERRIGSRSFVVGDLEVHWILPRKRRAPEWLGRVVEVSVSGGVILADSRLPVAVPGEATIRFERADTVVSIVHADPTDRADTMAFAVEWVEFDDAFRTRLFHILSQGRPYESSSPA